MERHMMTNEQTSTSIELRELACQPIVSIRETVQVAALGEAQGDMLRDLVRFLRQQGVEPAGPPFVRYHSFGDTITDLEVGVPVDGPVTAQGRVVPGELRAG